MKKDLNELKKLTNNLKKTPSNNTTKIDDLENFTHHNLNNISDKNEKKSDIINTDISKKEVDKYSFAEEVMEEETLSLQDKELELIIKALERNNGRRKAAAKELGISERTLYRKIKQYDLEI